MLNHCLRHCGISIPLDRGIGIGVGLGLLQGSDIHFKGVHIFILIECPPDSDQEIRSSLITRFTCCCWNHLHTPRLGPLLLHTRLRSGCICGSTCSMMCPYMCITRPTKLWHCPCQIQPPVGIPNKSVYQGHSLRQQ